MFDERDVYAALGMDAPTDQPEAAGPADAGEKAQGLTDPAVRQEDGGQDAASGPLGSYPKGTRAASTGDGQQSAGGAGIGGETDSSAGPRNDRLAEEAGRLPAQQNGGSGTASGQLTPAAPTGDGGQIDRAADDGGQAAQEPMSREERARQAQLRRNRERDAAIEAARTAATKEAEDRHKQELEEIFKAAGMTDRYNGGKPIQTMEEFRAWQAQAQAAGLSRQLKAGQLTPESFQAAVEASPAVQAAKEMVAKLEAREQAQKAQEQSRQFEQMVADELAQIHRLDPGINSLQDILARDTGKEFARLVDQRGMTYLEAFRQANFDRLIQAQTMAAAEGAARQQHSKDHMRTVVSTGGTAPEVPRDVIELYRELDPTMTPAQIREDYARWMGK